MFEYFKIDGKWNMKKILTLIFLVSFMFSYFVTSLYLYNLGTELVETRNTSVFEITASNDI